MPPDHYIYFDAHYYYYFFCQKPFHYYLYFILPYAILLTNTADDYNITRYFYSLSYDYFWLITSFTKFPPDVY